MSDQQHTEQPSPQMDPTDQISNAHLPTSHKRSKYFVPIIAGVLALALISVALASYTIGRNSVETTEESNSVETINFEAQNFEADKQPIATSEASLPDLGVDTTTEILLADPEIDGYVGSDGIVSNQKEILVGRDLDSVTRGLVGFDLSDLPTGITIKAAQLRLYQANTRGTPYTLIGDVRVDHLTYGDSIDSDDYSSPALLSNFATASISKRIGWNEIDTTEVVRDDIANARSRSQYRIHYSLETTGGSDSGDFAVFTSADSKSKNQPQLVVEYY